MVRLLGERQGYFGTESGIALLVCSAMSMILAAGAVLATAVIAASRPAFEALLDWAVRDH